mgnify:CR=1 FL=1
MSTKSKSVWGIILKSIVAVATALAGDSASAPA